MYLNSPTLISQLNGGGCTDVEVHRPLTTSAGPHYLCLEIIDSSLHGAANLNTNYQKAP